MLHRSENHDLSGQNTFRMKVSCRCYIEYDSIDDLKSLDFSALPQPVISIGEGSNLLFTGDFPGTVLHSKIDYIKYFDVGADEVPLAVGSGVKWDTLVAKACADGLWGLENLSGIPGTAGAAAVQNIGAYGVEVKDVIAGVTCFDIKERTRTAFKQFQCRYGYRDSIFKAPENKGRYIITGVLLKLSRTAKPQISYGALKSAFPQDTPQTPQEVRDAVLRIRNGKLPDPKELGSAGSFFKNPIVTAAQFLKISEGFETVPHYILEGGFIKVPAAWMIEQCGFKGAVRGGAAVYQKQPLVIVNNSGEAAPQDILSLEKEVIDAVRGRFGVELHPEVEHI